ncbi:MAG: hypothetical protein K2I08_04195 [Muribaculaceae bacterium]|nr:hypothetical protein [Muribaculaceae bacterium]
MTANPINIASRLILYTDSAKVATALKYYGYERSSEATDSPQSAPAGLSSGETTVYRHPDGTTITISFPKTDSNQTIPTVQVKSKVSRPEAEKILQDLDYKKTSTGYETTSSKYSPYITRCTLDPNNTITFRRLPK